MARISINDAQHPARQKAIFLMEGIAARIGNEEIFDGELWYEIEDMLTHAIYEYSKNRK